MWTHKPQCSWIPRNGGFEPVKCKRGPSFPEICMVPPFKYSPSAARDRTASPQWRLLRPRRRLVLVSFLPEASNASATFRNSSGIYSERSALLSFARVASKPWLGCILGSSADARRSCTIYVPVPFRVAFSPCSGIFAPCQSSQSSCDSPAAAADEDRKANKRAVLRATGCAGHPYFTHLKSHPLSSNLC